MTDRQAGLEKLLKLSRIIAVLVIDDAATAVPLARALVKGGVRLIEITLRTPAAWEAIRRIAGEVEGAVTGAGTLLTSEQFAEADRIGCPFTGRHGERDAPAARTWLPAAEIFPRRAGGRRRLSQIYCLAARQSALLPNRRH